MISYDHDRKEISELHFFFSFLSLKTQWPRKPMGKIQKDVGNELFKLFRKKIILCVYNKTLFLHSTHNHLLPQFTVCPVFFQVRGTFHSFIVWTHMRAEMINCWNLTFLKPWHLSFFKLWNGNDNVTACTLSSSIGRPVENKKKKLWSSDIYLLCRDNMMDESLLSLESFEWIYYSNMDIFESKSLGALLTIKLRQ